MKRILGIFSIIILLAVQGCKVQETQSHKAIVLKVSQLTPAWSSNYEQWESYFRTLHGNPGSVYGYLGNPGDTVLVQKIIYSNGYYKWAVNRR